MSSRLKASIIRARRLPFRRACSRRREQKVFQSGRPEQNEDDHHRDEQSYHGHDASLLQRSQLLLGGNLVTLTMRPNGVRRTSAREPCRPIG
jgi:hypothetical protein